jgi:hypothetical protein
MVSGGARARSGPPPEFDALRRERNGNEWTKLPKECTRPVPEWPVLAEDPTVAELAYWNELWRMPQAHVWHADHTEMQVAAYVRNLIESLAHDAPNSKRVTQRQQADGLLLTVMSLHAARYVITDSPEAIMLDQTIANHQANRPVGRTRTGRPSTSARARMQVVPDADVEVEEPEANEDDVE